MNVSWNYPTSIHVGADRLDDLPSICQKHGISNPLLVTDPGLIATPIIRRCNKVCELAGIEVGIFSDIKGNPTGSNVDSGVSCYVENNHDSVIAVGGGSALDAGKAIATIARQTCSLWDLEDIGDNWQRADPKLIPPIIAIPTTAGTGSEVGRAAVIVDENTLRKVIIFHPDMVPADVILDPVLTLSLPPKLTAATGMDALSHNLEAYCAPSYHPMAEGIAMKAMALIKENLPVAVDQGEDISARTHMLVASLMGATAFQRGLGGMHALAHPLGAIYDAHHGMLNAILMPYVLAANRSAIEARIERLAKFLDLPPTFDSFLDWIYELRAEIGIPNTLADIGIDDDMTGISKMAAADPSAGSNPINFTAEEYAAIALNAIAGKR